MSGRFAGALGAILLGLGAVILPGPWGGTEVPPPGAPVEGGAPDAIERGRRLYRKLDCVRCHTVPRMRGGINVPASLRGVGSRAQAGWLERYLLDPEPLRFRSEGTRPGVRMPALVTSREDARDLTAFLMTWVDTLLVPPIAGGGGRADDPDLLAEGRTLFDQYQCRGCHRLQGSGGTVGPALDGVGSRRPAAYVYALLENPERVIPGTPMENKQLWPEEVRALTAFLMTMTDP